MLGNIRRSKKKFSKCFAQRLDLLHFLTITFFGYSGGCDFEQVQVWIKNKFDGREMKEFRNLVSCFDVFVGFQSERKKHEAGDCLRDFLYVKEDLNWNDAKLWLGRNVNRGVSWRISIGL